MTTTRSRGKQGETNKRSKSLDMTEFFPSKGTEVKVDVITGVAPITLLEPTPANLEALEKELRESEASLRHYQDKVVGLRKIIDNMIPRVVRR